MGGLECGIVTDKLVWGGFGRVGSRVEGTGERVSGEAPLASCRVTQGPLVGAYRGFGGECLGANCCDANDKLR